MTMHGAKGLEYEVVFVIESNEGVTPYKKAGTPEELEEERRLFYVAMTRAKKKLFITYVKEKTGRAKPRPVLLMNYSSLSKNSCSSSHSSKQSDAAFNSSSSSMYSISGSSPSS